MPCHLNVIAVLALLILTHFAVAKAAENEFEIESGAYPLRGDNSIGELISGDRQIDAAEQYEEYADIIENADAATLRDLIRHNPHLIAFFMGASPYRDGDQLRGYALRVVRPVSAFSTHDIRNGDIITNVNGVELNSRKNAILAIRILVKADYAQLKILRNGETLNIHVPFLRNH
ncbi:PDZ domain-containing protein [Granulosicoccus sp.]|nr:PDZ domain-containing protein [Granulosicoccus sp.]